MNEVTKERLDDAVRRLASARDGAASLSTADIEVAYKAIQSARFALKRTVAAEVRENRFKVLQVLVQALIPISVAFLAWQLPLQQKLADQELARVSVVPDLMDDLFSDDKPKQELSVRVIKLVLKEEGDKLLDGLLESPTLPEAVRDVILDAKLQSTIDDLFDGPRSGRQRAYDILKYRQADKAAVIRGLVSKSLGRPINDDGVYNAAQLLDQMSASELQLERDLLVKSIPGMSNNGDKTAALLASVRAKLGTP